MLKRIIQGLVILGIIAGCFFGFAPGIIENSQNTFNGRDLYETIPRAEALHKTLTIVDLHADTLMWDRNLLERSDRGHVDLPRLRAGNVALQLFSSVSKTPKGMNYDGNSGDSDNITALVIAQLQPIRTWFSLVERSLYHAAKLDGAVADSGGQLRKIDTPTAIDALIAARAGGNGPTGAMLTIEGLHDLEGQRANLDRLYAAGFRMASLTHFFDNDLAGSMHGKAKGGLTPFGRQIMAAMEDKGMILDVAHLSHAGLAEVLATARRPVVSSHGGVLGTCGTNRNLSDDELRGIAKTGGLIGIGSWDGAVCKSDPRGIARAIRHAAGIAGVDHVALGSDYDGATSVAFDTSELIQITQALIDFQFTDDEIRAIMGGNALRVLRAGMVPLAQATPPS